MKVAPARRATSAGFIARAWYSLLLQVVPALEGRVVAPARHLHLLLEQLLPAEVLRRRARSAGAGALALPRLRLDAFVAARLGGFQRLLGRARLLVSLVKRRAAFLRQR
jgi:hypothetical protein